MNSDVITFLRRAYQEKLEAISIHEVTDAFAHTFAEYGKKLGGEALDLAAAATDGYPYLIQMVGYQVWEQSDKAAVTMDDVQRGVDLAKEYLAKNVHEASLADLSPTDRLFLNAMAEDEGPSRLGDLAKRMGKTSGYVSQYRKRLLESGVIVESDYGYVNFALPYMRNYLRPRDRIII